VHYVEVKMRSQGVKMIMYPKTRGDVWHIHTSKGVLFICGTRLSSRSSMTSLPSHNSYLHSASSGLQGFIEIRSCKNPTTPGSIVPVPNGGMRISMVTKSHSSKNSSNQTDKGSKNVSDELQIVGKIDKPTSSTSNSSPSSWLIAGETSNGEVIRGTISMDSIDWQSLLPSISRGDREVGWGGRVFRGDGCVNIGRGMMAVRECTGGGDSGECRVIIVRAW